MIFSGFKSDDFETFYLDGLDERMQAIQTRIQPKFQAISEEILPFLEKELDKDMYLHIAKHARRTVNPPNDTWSAYCDNKRGYKKHPHFQIGLWHDHVFVWLAYIYELPHKKEIASKFKHDIEDIKKVIPADYYISQDHMKNEATIFKDVDFERVLDRFETVKKSELLIGRRFDKDDDVLKDGKAFVDEVKQTFSQLRQVYLSSLNI
ncbi:YktB family protein [Gracilibacillus marinus]|jgi:uncharacterized protein YktB (UPF0637 family)|uniref:UPF0637 protein ACFOZ1_05545 n=1 Tax=Gracilibacillus marinus TaxID=630535 RepID=A0ABV8VUE6_9BACI